MLNVAVGIILKGSSVFLAKRATEKHQGGLWEFPGGKCEKGELPVDALARELQEEIGISVVNSVAFETLTYDYGDKQVRLHFYIVDEFLGEPLGAEGQLTQWVEITRLHQFDFPAANAPIVEKLINTSL